MCSLLLFVVVCLRSLKKSAECLLLPDIFLMVYVSHQDYSR